ncbi:Rad1-domain-containing protein [Schizopora paradoxa]|uniref:Rad1-domain-containing protein n=1 Tax=Schizopora paradoxa TaxID=27342 RepID=A0A0H2S2J6_9AGAM|nr:Rad1-domain-containing protein [Schizopora paradoxa]
MSHPRNSQATLDVLKATAPDVRAFASLLRGIYFNNVGQRATMTINDTGLMVSVEESHTLLAAAWIAKELFDEFDYHSEVPSSQDSEEPSEPMHTALCFKLHTLLECLNIFGTAQGSSSSQATKHVWKRNDTGPDAEGDGANAGRGNGRIDNFFPKVDGKGTGMRLSYSGRGYPLKLLLAEDANGPMTTCELVTYDAEDQLDLQIDSANLKLRCILKSAWLRDAISELDPTSERLTFIGKPPLHGTLDRGQPQPQLRIHATGTFGSAEMDYPDDPEVLETFHCDESVSFSYRFSHITKTLKALQNSSKTSLRIDENGLLSLQFLSSSVSPRGGAVDSILDFKFLSIDES